MWLQTPTVEAVPTVLLSSAWAGGPCTRDSCPFKAGDSPLLNSAEAVTTCDRGTSRGKVPFDQFFERRSCFLI